MRKKEVQSLVGQPVQFRSNRTRNSLEDIQVGYVEEVLGREVCIRGDWHDIRTLEIFQVLDSE